MIITVLIIRFRSLVGIKVIDITKVLFIRQLLSVFWIVAYCAVVAVSCFVYGYSSLDDLI